MPNRAERRRMKTSELREQAIEALKQEPYIDLETDDGQVFRVWHPLLVDDEAQVRIDRYNTGAELDKDDAGEIKVPLTIDGKPAGPSQVRLAQAVFGPELHAQFVAAGGHSNDVQLAWNEMGREHEEADTALALDKAEVEDPKSVAP